MKPDMTVEEGHLQSLHRRWDELKALAGQLTADKRWMSTQLSQDDPLVVTANSYDVQVGRPLTIGTLLAAVLAKTDSIENAIACYERRLHPDVFLHPDALQAALRFSH